MSELQTEINSLIWIVIDMNQYAERSDRGNYLELILHVFVHVEKTMNFYIAVSWVLWSEYRIVLTEYS
jgi:hypothetical protein